MYSMKSKATRTEPRDYTVLLFPSLRKILIFINYFKLCSLFVRWDPDQCPFLGCHKSAV